MSVASAVYRTHGMNHILGRQATGGRDHGFSSGQPADLGCDSFAFLKDRRSTRMVNCAINSTTDDEMRIRSIDDGFGRLFRDVRRSMEVERLAAGESESSDEIGHSGP